MLVVSIDKIPTGSCVSMGRMGIPMLTSSIVHKSLALLLRDYSPQILDLFFFLFDVRRVETSPIPAKGTSFSITVPFISEKVSFLTP